MTSQIRNYWLKLKLHGLHGAWLFLQLKLGERRSRKFFTDNFNRHRNTQPERGITFLGDFSSTGSGGKVSRDFVLSLRDAGIPFQAAFRPEKECDPSGNHVDELLTSPNDFNLRRFSHVIEFYNGSIQPGLLANHARIVFWEFESGFLEFYPSFARPTTVIAMSDFNAAYFRRILPPATPVVKILYPFRPYAGELPAVSDIRARYQIPVDSFVVFYNFDFGSSYHRKNPYGAIHAFAKAFSDKPNTMLVFKTMSAKRYPERVAELESLARELDIADRFKMISNYIPESDLYGLTNACDCYLSLHRGEGFGLGVAEAMSLGKPVIVTDYSATTEFCNSENSIPIPFKMIPVRRDQIDNSAYNDVKEWADPDIDAAAQALQALYQSPELRTRLGSAAQAFITDHFSTGNFRKSVDAFLAESAVSQPRSRS